MLSCVNCKVSARISDRDYAFGSMVSLLGEVLNLYPKWRFGSLYGFYRATACNATHGIAVGILYVHLCVRQMRVSLKKLNDALRIF